MNDKSDLGVGKKSISKPCSADLALPKLLPNDYDIND